ncbi:unnamed protein product, partial [marine sediment metagenome]
MNNTLDVRQLIDQQPIGRYQKWVVFLGFLIIALDGLDVAIIGFIAPQLKSDWGLGAQSLGPVLSAALIGLALGALIAGPLADRYGRKAVLRYIAFPHLLDRYKPGVIGVLRSGRRFTNESNSYHDVGAALIEACAGQAETAMWLVCDRRTLAKYGLGFAKPAPMPLGPLLRNGYLLKGKTLAELAGKAGIDAQGLERTVRDYNLGAVQGEDRQYGRGSNSFNRYLADPQQQPNPCVAPVGEGPYFAVKVIMGDLGTFDGLRTSVVGEVLAADGQAIEGLYAVGNDRASIMGGNYPGAGITLGPIMTFGYITGRHLA